MPETRKVAVIGAGISGVCSAAHALQQGLDVTLFERSSIAGGVWHFDDEAANDPEYPNEFPSKGDWERVVFDEADIYLTPPRTPEEAQDGNVDHSFSTDELRGLSRVSFAPPGPCYAGLMNNVSLPAMQTSLGAWPTGLPDFVSQKYLEEYIQDIAKRHKVNDITRYNTRVEQVLKENSKWKVYTTTYSHGTLGHPSKLHKRIEYFDSVIVASGHYHMPRVPDIPGLKEWKTRYPSRIMHSKGYRDSSKFANKTVLIIGAGVSSIDIAKEIAAVGGTVYQSSRGGKFDLPATSLPTSAHRVSGVQNFVLDPNPSSILDDTTAPVPGTIHLTDSTTISNIDHIILATGYITSYPFLPELTSDTVPRSAATHDLIVTSEGDMTHNLHKDIFYIPDPTLAFVGVPYHISTFSLFDFQAQVVARVFAGKVRVPREEVMRAEYVARVERKGLGREMHSLRATGEEMKYVEEWVEWVNSEGRGGERMEGHTKRYLRAHKKQREALAERFGGKKEDWVPERLLDMEFGEEGERGEDGS